MDKYTNVDYFVQKIKEFQRFENEIYKPVFLKLEEYCDTNNIEPKNLTLNQVHKILCDNELNKFVKDEIKIYFQFLLDHKDKIEF